MYRGIGASPGGVVGNVCLFLPQKVRISRRPIPPDQTETEIKALQNALAEVMQDIHELSLKMDADKAYTGIFDAYELIIDDPTVLKQTEDIIRQWNYPAAYSYSLTLGQMLNVIENLPDEMMRSRARDLRDIQRRVVEKLTGQQENPLANLDQECIIVAHDLAPSDTALLKRDLVLAIVTEVGSKSSHTTILAQALGIPAVVGTTDITQSLQDGDTLLVDGYEGVLVFQPHPVAEEAMKRSWARAQAKEQSQLAAVELPAETLDGFLATVSVNIEFPEEIEQMKKYGSRGIGLYRTEFLYMNQKELPGEEKQYKIYAEIAQGTLPWSAIIRTVDLGGDKFASDLDIPTEVNPYLGLRGIRLSLARQDIFRTQLRAILRASVHGNLRIMFPMISDVGEVIAARKILDEEKEKLIAEGTPVDPNLQVGVMIEVPSAALTVKLLAPHVDFFSIGTNDLIQYAMAVERGNQRIAYLYQPFHPCILNLIREVIETAHRNYLWVGLCGEMAGFPLAVPILIGLGLDEFSVPPRAVPRVKDIIRSLRYEDMRKLAYRLCRLGSEEEILDAVRHSLPRNLIEGIG
jgi:phosphoenolpyruvate-protein phosphotransferase (PTS system enzyme I)